MMDQFMEQVATKRNSGIQSFTIAFSWVVMAITGIYGMLLFSQITYAFQESTTAGIVQIVASLLFLGTAVLIYFFKDRLRTEIGRAHV